MNKAFLYAFTLTALALSGASVQAASIMDSVPATPSAGEQAPAASGELDRIVAVVNNDIITEHELEQRVHTVAINLRRQNIQLPAMELLRAQVLERLISERAILQRARQTGIRVDDQMVNASVEQIARQNNLSIEELRQRLAADGVNFASFRNEIRDEITTQRLREREVNEKIDISESEIDAYLAEQAGIKGDDKMEYHVEHILLPVETPAENDSVKTAAESLAKRARDGENFSSLAASFSLADDAMKGGDLGWLQPGDTVPEFEGVMNKLKPGQISDPIRTPYGYHLIQVVERRTEKDGNPERMRVAARQAIRQKKLAEASYEWERELRDQAFVEIRDPQLKDMLRR